MATLDVSFVTVCAEFGDTFQVIRRTESLGVNGRTNITEALPQSATGTLYPTDDNSLVRQSDYERSMKTYTCVTPFRLRMAAAGGQPDIVLYRGNRFIVSDVEDYSQYGAGFVVAKLSSIRITDEPPQ